GDLATRSNAEANAIVQQAFDLWNEVRTSTISLTTAQLDVDINSSNFTQFIPAPDNSVLNADDSYNPVVYDSDGKIIEAFFGDSSAIAGFAASIYTEYGSYFKEGYAVINGKTQSSLNDTELTLLVAHEIAHFFGLDHSQAGISNQDSFFCSSDIPENYPLMYPILCRESGLHADDISAVSVLYPAANLYDSYGTLQGHFVDEAGTAILGANIWAENIKTGETVSVVSDYLRQGNGYYKLLLAEGSYTLHANSINTLFYDSSGIGPYTQTQTDISFTAPHPIAEVDYLGTNDSNEEVITVSPGQTIEINFSSIGTSVILPDNDNNSGAMSYAGLLILFGVLAHRRFAFKPVKIGNKL
ncbi:MAG: hypothetical protein LJE83_01660, partial [Gammaproteobacteria bacterium]|nr:hypothetical protein [Gammaproteobacteria bacterium]